MSSAEEFFARFNRVIGSSLQKIRPEFFSQVVNQLLRRAGVPILVMHHATTHNPVNVHLLTPATSHHPRTHGGNVEPTVDKNVRMPGSALLQFPNEEKFCPTPAQEIQERLDVFFGFSFGPELANYVASIVARLSKRPKVNVPLREKKPLD